MLHVPFHRPHRARFAAFPFLGGLARVGATAPAMVSPLPDSLPYGQGGALPMNSLTCHFALRERGRLAAGETVLVHGASAGVSVAGIQTAHMILKGQIPANGATHFQIFAGLAA